MEKNEIKFSTHIKDEEIFKTLINNYPMLITDFYELQRIWFYRSYQAFKDLDKYLILIYLFKKHLDSYTDYYIKKSFDEFYSQEPFEIQSFNIADVSKELLIKKETTRRKLMELQEIGVIQKTKKIIKINQKAIRIHKPKDVLTAISRLTSNFSLILYKNKSLKKHYSAEEFKSLFKKNYTYYWRYFLNFQIPYLIKWKNFYNNDLETFIIMGMIIYNQNLYLRKNFGIDCDESYYKYEYVKNLKKDTMNHGINAMSISDLTGIPRPTVLRKINILIKLKLIVKDENSLYKLNENSKLLKHDINNMRQETAKQIGFLLSKFYNFFDY
tara:strand:+ start:2138 stop:3118 length:981 start_codon:yes stop_codon:yes gene_type:complete